MAEIVCTNRVASPAAKGQAIKVTLNGADALSQLPQLTIGDTCIIDSSTAEGVIYSIDEYGHSFMVTPARPEVALGTSTDPGGTNIFDINDSVTVTI